MNDREFEQIDSSIRFPNVNGQENLRDKEDILLSASKTMERPKSKGGNIFSKPNMMFASSKGKFFINQFEISDLI